MLGWSETQFAPDKYVKLGEFAATAYRIAGCPNVPEKVGSYRLIWENLSDGFGYEEKSTHWSFDPCIWAVENGIIETGHYWITEGSPSYFRGTSVVMDHYDVLSSDEITRREIVLGLCFFAEYFNKNISVKSDISGFRDFGELNKKVDFSAMGYTYTDYRSYDKDGYYEYIQLDPADVFGWAVAAGIIKGYDDNTLRPHEYVTRAEYAVMLERFLKYIGK